MYSKGKLLTREGEQEIGKRLNQAKARISQLAKIYLNNGKLDNYDVFWKTVVNLRKVIGKRDKKKLEGLVSEVERCVNTYVLSNQGLVHKEAKKYTHNREHYDILVSLGNCGLLNGSYKFDIRMKKRISTYVCWWIEQLIKRKGFDLKRPFSIPEYVDVIISKIRREIDKNPLGVNLEEIALKLKTSKQRVENIKKVLETRYIREKDYASEKESKEVISNFQAKDNLDELVEISSKILDEKEFRIICLRLKEKTLEETGKILGLTKEGVRQIQRQAVKKVNNYCKSRDSRYTKLGSWDKPVRG